MSPVLLAGVAHIKPATIGRACYKVWRVCSSSFCFIDYLYFRGAYPPHLWRSGEAIDDPRQA
jgi:hypothetical protein